jgi:sugar lactone lactonase YvrE
MAKKLIRLTFLLLGVGLLSVGLVGGLDFSATPAPEPAQAARQKAKPTLNRTEERFSFVRTAHAASLDGELDAVADKVYGQVDFTTNTAPITTTASSLSQPSDLFVFDSGQVFVADTANNRVLGWNCVDSYTNGNSADFVLGQPDFATTTALDPPTAASMNGPTGVTVGFDGFLYVSDTGNNRVLVFIPANYEAYLDNEEVYYDPDEHYCAQRYWLPSDFYAPIYINGQAAQFVLGQPNFTSGTARPTAGDTLNQPMGLITDANDNLVVADHGNNRVLIYMWNEAGSIGPNANWVVGQEISGNGNESFTFNAAPDPPTQRSMNGPTSVAADLLGNAIYVADTGNNRVLLFGSDPIDNLADGIIGQPDYISNTANHGGLSASSLFMPMGVKINAGNRLYVADTGNQRVLVFDQVTPDGAADGVFGQPDFTSSTANHGGISASSLYSPTGIATDVFYADVYIVDTGNNRALQYNRPLPNPMPDIVELDPGTVRAGADGFTLDIWGTGILSDTVVQINGITRTFGSKFLGFTQVKIAASEIVTTGQLTVTLRSPAPGGGLSAPVPLTIFEPVAGDDLADSVLGQQGFTTNYGAFALLRANTLFDPAGVVVDPESGRLFVSDLGNARVLSWPNQQAQRDGTPADLVIGKPNFTTYFNNAEAGRNLIRPAGLALDSGGNLYVADAQAGLVAIYTRPFTNAMASTLLIHGLNNPLALALDSQDNLYVAESFNHRVLFYEKPLSTKETTPDRVIGQPDMTSTAPNRGGSISANSLHYPSGLTLDEADNLYVSDSGNHRVLVYLNPVSGDITADIVFGQQDDFTTGTANKGGLSAESLNYPYGLGIETMGSLWVVDSDNHRVLRFNSPLTGDRIADKVLGQGNSFSRAGASQRPGQDTMRRPTALAVAPNGMLFVADTGNSRVLGFQGVQGTTVESKLYLPSVRK